MCVYKQEYMKSKLRASIFVFLGACSFGVLSTIVKTAYAHGFTLSDVTGSQTIIGMCILWLIYFVNKTFKNKSQTNNSKKLALSNKLWLACKVMFAGSFTGLVGVLYYKSVSYLPASIAIILLMQNVWMSFIIEKLFLRKRPSRRQLYAMIIVLIASILAAGVFEDRVYLDIRGIIYGLASALSYSIFMLTSARIGNELEHSYKSALMISGACLLTFIIFPKLFILSDLFSSGILPWGLSLAIFGMVIPPFLYSKSIPKTGLSLAAILGAAELPVAVIASSLVLSERLSVLQILGIILIIFAIALPNINRLKYLDKQ